MNNDRFTEAAEAIPELRDLNAAAGMLWASAQHATPDQYPGFEVAHDGVRATFTVRHSPTTHDSLSLFRDADGVWNIEEQWQRPTVETEGFGQFARVTTTHPLLPGERPTHVVEQSGPHTQGEFTPQAITQPDQGLDVQSCQYLLGVLRTVRGETEPTGPRFPRIHGWLAKIGLTRG